jgi:hypothetical protein
MLETICRMVTGNGCDCLDLRFLFGNEAMPSMQFDVAITEGGRLVELQSLPFGRNNVSDERDKDRGH